MFKLPNLTKPRQKANLLIATFFVAVQLPLVLLMPKMASAGNHENNSNNGNGNNGTIKIVGQELGDEDPGNEPHIEGCKVFIEYYGFDEGERTSSVTFEAMPPTAGQLSSPIGPQSFEFEGNGEGGVLDDTAEFTLAFTGDPHLQGYKVKVTVETPGSKGNDTKSKVFWVEGCEEEEDLGSITIVKDARPNNIQDFIFSATGLTGTTNFTLDDDGNNTNTYKNAVKYDDLTAKEYSFTETAVEGWTLESINCLKEDAATVVTVAKPKVTINLAEGDDVTCTFVNVLDEEEGNVLGDSDKVTTGQVLGTAQVSAPVGGVSAGAAAGSITSSLFGLGSSVAALGYGVASLRKKQ